MKVIDNAVTGVVRQRRVVLKNRIAVAKSQVGQPARKQHPTADQLVERDDAVEVQQRIRAARQPFVEQGLRAGDADQDQEHEAQQPAHEP
jgi:hypothetical protein